MIQNVIKIPAYVVNTRKSNDIILNTNRKI